MPFAGSSRRGFRANDQAPDPQRLIGTSDPVEGTYTRSLPVEQVGATVPRDGHNWPTVLVETLVMSALSRVGIPSAMLLLVCGSLGGCITSSANSSLMDARAEAPKPSALRAYMPVEDVPSDRKTPALTADEQSKLKKELSAVRDRQTEAAKAQK